MYLLIDFPEIEYCDRFYHAICQRSIKVIAGSRRQSALHSLVETAFQPDILRRKSTVVWNRCDCQRIFGIRVRSDCEWIKERGARSATLK